MKPDFLSFDSGYYESVDLVAEKMLSLKNINGVTFSGGEPFEQALPLARLAKVLTSVGLNIVVYSGYRFDALVGTDRFAPLLEAVDMLIAGEYQEELSGPFLWRGSSNQTLHVRTGAQWVELQSPPDRLQEIQVSLDSDSLRITGFPSIDMQQKLTLSLAKRGIELKEVPVKGICS